jgi:hypothetical protein
MSKIITDIQKKTVSHLSDLVKELLADVNENVFVISNADVSEVTFRFEDQINRLFEDILGEKSGEEQEEETINFDDLTLVLEEDMDVLVAVDGMVAAARNKILGPYISFNTRLNSLFENDPIDESNNPLDPGNVLEAFKEASTKLAMTADRSLLVFRRFSTKVFGKLPDVLTAANRILIDNNILPDLGDNLISSKRVSARVTSRSSVHQDDTSTFGMVQREPADSDARQQPRSEPELFSVMQNLMHAPLGAPSSATPAGEGAADSASRDYVVPAEMLSPDQLQGATVMPPPEHTVEVIDQKQLVGLLSNIQNTLAQLPQIQPGQSQQGSRTDVSPNIKESLAEMLQEKQEEGVVNAVDRQSHDVIHLVTMLYEAIWNDDAVPIPIKELIGRTQITVIQVALTDTDFFNQEGHPARALLNEFASAGIGWSEVDDLQEDGLYKTMSALVQKILTDYEGNDTFFEDLLAEFKNYRAREFARGRRLEQQIKHAQEGRTREEFARKLVAQRVEERVMGRELDPFVSELLSGDFHQFLVLLVLKEGPGSKAWKQAMNTIDVLLWTVQPHDNEEDRERLDTINPRLLGNLQRALRIAQVDAEKIAATISTLKEVQQASLGDLDEDLLELDKMLESEEVVFEGVEDREESAEGDTEPVQQQESLEEGDKYLEKVDKLAVGTWYEFRIEEDQNVRCRLAARINAIDKFIFVNRQGVKVLELNRMALALEFKHDTVREISDGALETVIGNLRESQSEQRAAGAYQSESSS